MLFGIHGALNERQPLIVSPEDHVSIMTRGHANDMLCETVSLTLPARYIGMIGSQKAAWANQALKEEDFTATYLKQVTTPMGLPNHAETPAEIAMSIAA